MYFTSSRNQVLGPQQPTGDEASPPASGAATASSSLALERRDFLKTAQEIPQHPSDTVLDPPVEIE